MMKKISVFLAAVAVFICATVFSVNAASGVNSAYSVKGGKVANADEFVEAFTDENGTPHAEKISESEIRILNNVVLKSTVVITDGNYTLNGGGCTVYRGFSDGEMFLLNGSASGGTPTLVLGTDEKNESWDEQNFQLCIDGNKENFPEALYSMISVKGRAVLKVNGRVILRNSSVVSSGGAIFAELDIKEGAERTPLVPEVYLKNCRITDCSALSAGGAVAFNCYYSGTNEGILSIENTVFERNTSKNEEKIGMGGALYTVGGEVTLSTLTVNDNSADIGGAFYLCSDASVTSVSAENNSATSAGGVLYGASLEGISCNISLTSFTADYNSSDGIGGAIVNEGRISADGTIISNNTSAGDGGGVYNLGTFEFLEGNILSNTSSGRGGGVYCKGKDSEFIMKNGEINSNSAGLCGGMYCEGSFQMSGGAIGNNKSEFPEVIFKDEVIISGGVSVQNDVVGLCATEADGTKSFPYLRVEKDAKLYYELTLALCTEKTDTDGNVKGYKNVSKSGELFFFGDEAAMEAVGGMLKVKSRGLLSYKLKDTGVSSVRFVFLPIWAWIGILICVLGVLVFIFRHKLICAYNDFRKRLKNKDRKVIHHKKKR